MFETLPQLDLLLSTQRPAYYATLNPGLTEEALSALEAKHGLLLPAELRRLYQWRNGQAANCFEAFVNNSMFLPLERAMKSAAELTSMIGSDLESENWWNAHWLPLFDNGGGDLICHDSQGTFTGKSGQLIQFWHDDTGRKVIAPSLDAFLRQLVHFYQSTPPDSFDEYFEVMDAPGYPLRFKAG